MTHGVGVTSKKLTTRDVMMCVNWRFRGFCTICDCYHDERGVPIRNKMFTGMMELREELRNEVSWYSTWTMTTL